MLTDQPRKNNPASEPRKIAPSWQKGKAKTVTFIVTGDCQLACRYCYFVDKNKRSRMSFTTAARAVDYVLRERALFPEPSIIWEFIGGEPFLEIDLVDRVSEYIKQRMAALGHPWSRSYRFNFSTNGLLYHTRAVQRYIEKNHDQLSIGLTIDGTRAKHDLQRVYPDGRGSYADVVRNVPLWLKQFPAAATKVTVAGKDIPHVRESVLHLWSLSIKDVNINVVFEDEWREGDDRRFEEELVRLADAIIDRGLYRDHTCSFFSETVGGMLDCVSDKQNWCGAGRMLSIDHQGNFYPCTRFAQFALKHKRAITVGNLDQGLDLNRLRPFLALDRITQSPRGCVECTVSNGCAWCQAANYDYAGTDTIYQRATFICKMHQARVRANNYYWHKLKRAMR